MNPVALRHLHVTLAGVSIAGFALRWLALRAGARWPRDRAARTLPHLVDTVFLATGLLLAWRIGQWPFANAWLTAKLAGLVAYVVLGTLALRRARTPAGRLAAFLAALAVFAWIVGVARLRTPSGWFAMLGG